MSYPDLGSVIDGLFDHPTHKLQVSLVTEQNLLIVALKYSANYQSLTLFSLIFFILRIYRTKNHTCIGSDNRPYNLTYTIPQLDDQFIPFWA